MAKPFTATSGPFTGVMDSQEPYDDTPNRLVGLQNAYLPDPKSGCGAFARPGFTATNGINVSTGQVQGVFPFTATDGTNYDFLFANGHVYRQNTDLTTAPTDVTPTNVAIATGTSTSPANVTSGRFIFCTALNNQLIVNDGVNKPWVGTNLSSTPITAATIDYNSPAATVLSRGSTDTKLATAAFTYALFASGSATQYTHTADAVGIALAAGTIPQDKWGVYRVVMASSDTATMLAGAANFTTGYASEALAIAAVPAVPVGQWNVGYFTVQTKTGTTFVGGTDALHGGASGNVANATNYYAGESAPWVAFGQPTLWVGSVVFVVRSVAGVSSPSTFAWSEPNQPTVGYQQTNYDDAWTYTQTNQTPIYCVVGTNDALYISRDLSWSAVYGAPGINLSSDATNATVSENVGCNAPATVRKIGDYIYFSDIAGRTNRFRTGGKIEPLWLQARAAYDTATANGQTASSAIQSYTWAEVEPNLNLYLVAAYPSTTTPFAPTTLYVYDALTGIYCGTWNIGTETLGIGGILRDANNQPTLIILGTLAGTNGQVWKLNLASANVWQDNGAPIASVVAETQRFGYGASTDWQVSKIRVVTGVDTPVTANLLTTNGMSAMASQSPAGVVLLSRGSTDTAVASVAFDYVLSNTGYSKAAVATGTALAAGTIPQDKWGVYRYSINAAGTITSTAGTANFTTGYTTEALAIAALPATPVGSWNMGSLTVLTKSGTTFIGGTDGLAGGTSGNVASQTNFSAGETSFDGTYLTTFLPEGARGRGAQVSVSPTATLSQWKLYRVEAELIASDGQPSER